MKKFYKDVSIKDIDNEFQILLDGREISTPCEKKLKVPSKQLAEAIKTEWSSQGEDIDIKSMPITRVVNTALDRTDEFFDDITTNLINYSHTDLLCYLNDDPKELYSLQKTKWLPILSWIENEIGAKLKTTTSILPIQQDDKEISKIKDYIISCDIYFLTALYLTAQNLGSIILAIAFCEKYIDAQTAFSLAFLDEEYQESYWGLDKEEEKGRQVIKEEINNISYYLTLLE